MKTENQYASLTKRHLTNQKVLYFLLFFVCVLVISFFAGHTIPNATGVSAFNDVFSYWGLAASLSGYSWSPLMSTVEYYSCGYSLWLVPLYWMNLNAAQMFQIALMFNILMLIGMFLLCIGTLKALCPEQSPFLRLLIAFTATVYSNNLIQAQETWTEIPLCFTFWLLFFLVIRLSKSPTKIVCIFMGIVTGYMYLIHLRSVGVVLAVIVLMLILKAVKHINWPQFISFCAALSILILIQFLLMQWTKECVFTIQEDSAVSVNTYSGQTEKIILLFTSWPHFISFIRATLGKIFYLASSTLLIFFVAIDRLMESMMRLVKNKMKKGQFCFEEKSIIELFLLLSFAAMFAVSCIGISGVEGRLDLAVYGRYIECIMGPIIVYGLIVLTTKKIGIIRSVIYITLFKCLAFFTHRTLLYVYHAGGEGFNWPCCTVWQRLYEKIDNIYQFIPCLSLICLVFFGFFVLINTITFTEYKAAKKPIVKLLGIIAIAAAWLWCANVNSRFNEWQLSMKESLEPTMSFFEEKQKEPEYFYLVLSDEDVEAWKDTKLKYTGPKLLQSRFPRVTVQIISLSDYLETDYDIDSIFICLSTSTSEFIQLENTKIIGNRRYDLFTSPDSIWLRE